MIGEVSGVASRISSGFAGSLAAANAKAPDTAKIAATIISDAKSGAGSVDQLFGKIKDRLNPVDQGNVLRELDQLRALGSFGRFWNPFDDIADAVKDAVGAVAGAIKDAFSWLGEKAQKILNELAALPNEAANALADSMRGPNARALTAGEIRELRKIFGDDIDLSNVRIVNGPGDNPAAKAAFEIGGNPAITIGNTVYIRSDKYVPDLSKSPAGIETLAHEFTHVNQYQDMGFGSFFAKYAKDLKDIGDRDEVYRYETRPNTTYRTETLEGQAQMVGDYARYLAGDKNITAEQARDIERRLKGTGLFGL
jgi:Domain of unknown function (DUF4157)